MSKKHKLKNSIFVVLKHNRDGSFATKTDRKRILNLIADELYTGGYKLGHVSGIKQKHIKYLNELWKSQGLAIATVKNRNSILRWLCAKLGKFQVMPSNDKLGVGKRTYATNRNKAVDLAEVELDGITDKRVLVQIHLQRHLGLRREECIKLKPQIADKGDYIELQPSWCKGGRGRRVPVLSKEARYWLEEAKKLVTERNQSLIPKEKKYIQHRHVYDWQVNKAGIKHPHGLRHAYAQERYRKLTGWVCPANGGPSSKELTSEQKQIDMAARLKISAELGHSREAIVAQYCGK